jgi:tRNA pseudouridine38-40 synthase
MRLKLVVEYEGTNYSGWQLQARHDSIQGRIERSLMRIFSAPVRVFGSGRTDTGVHAIAQVAAIDIPREFEPAVMMRALNAFLPADIVIKEVHRCDPEFDPRRDARSRVYEYRVLNRAMPSVFERRFSWQVWGALDLRAMNACARVFVGEHNFVALRKSGSAEKSTVRRVLSSRWTRKGDILTYRIEANSFLRHQVRKMVRAMVDCGRGRMTARDVAAILRDRDRARSPAAAPPQGLFLVEVKY